MTDERDWQPGAAPLETRKFKMGRCVNCGAPLTGLTGPSGAPRAGAIMVCAYCSHVMEWSGRKLAPLSEAAIRDIGGDPDVLAAVELTGQLRKTFPQAACQGCGAPQDYGRIRCDKCGKPLVFPKSFVCPDCNSESFNPNDIAQGYCGRCHSFK
jgi:hypothetical protein